MREEKLLGASFWGSMLGIGVVFVACGLIDYFSIETFREHSSYSMNYGHQYKVVSLSYRKFVVHDPDCSYCEMKNMQKGKNNVETNGRSSYKTL